MQAVVLAGGLGTRIRSLTGDNPKALLLVGGRPIVEWVLRWLEREGCDPVVLCLGHRAAAVQEFVRSLSSGLRFRFSVEPEPLGTAGAVKWALPMLDDQFLVVNGDTLFDTRIAPLVQIHQQRRVEVTMALTEVLDRSRFGSVEIDAECNVRRFGEKRPEGGRGLINSGVYLMSKRVIESHAAAGPSSLECDVFPQLLERGIPFLGIPCPGRFFDVGTPEGYEEANRALSSLAGERVEGS